MSAYGKKVLLAGATGYIGAEVAKKLIAEGYTVICPVRSLNFLKKIRFCKYIKCDVTDPNQLGTIEKSFTKINYIISCLASRTGGPEDAWLVDYKANMNLLRLAIKNNISHYILLSAICVQKPMLEFQKAKLAFENELIRSDVTYSIVRATAFFKSLSGQIINVKNGKKFVIFDNGETTRCKPISAQDLSLFIVQCLDNIDHINKILPIGGPGPAITPLEMGQMLFKLTGQQEKFRNIPSNLFIFGGNIVRPFSKISFKIKNLNEFLKIAHYYSTESMLVWDEQEHEYVAENTPEFGKETLWEHYKNVLENGVQENELRSHKLF